MEELSCTGNGRQPTLDAMPDSVMETVTVVVVDDHQVVIEGIHGLMRNSSAIRIVGDAESGAEAVEKISLLQPRVVLLDLQLPDMTAAEVIRRSRANQVTAHFVIFTAYIDRVDSEVIARLGASGCLLKDASVSGLEDSIHRVISGELVVDDRIGDASSDSQPLLTQREVEVLRRCALGETNNEIAERLYLAPTTVKSYLQSAMQKLGARNRVHAVALARAQQWL